MATHTHKPEMHRPEHRFTDYFSVSRGRLTTALILIALGLVFFLGQSGRLDYGSPWWVLFIAIPGVVMLGGALVDYLNVERRSQVVLVEAAGGVIALLLSAIFIWDPTWSFTRNWNLPFLRDLGTVWPWLIVAAGVAVLYRAWGTSSRDQAVVGVVLCAVGATFLLNISWNAVWPLLIVAAGVGLLLARGNDAG